MIEVNEWAKKLDVPNRTIIDWVHVASKNGLDTKQTGKFMTDLHFYTTVESQTKKNSERHAIRKKWGIDPDTLEKVEAEESKTETTQATPEAQQQGHESDNSDETDETDSPDTEKEEGPDNSDSLDNEAQQQDDVAIQATPETQQQEHESDNSDNSDETDNSDSPDTFDDDLNIDDDNTDDNFDEEKVLQQEENDDSFFEDSGESKKESSDNREIVGDEALEFQNPNFNDIDLNASDDFQSLNPADEERYREAERAVRSSDEETDGDSDDEEVDLGELDEDQDQGQGSRRYPRANIFPTYKSKQRESMDQDGVINANINLDQIKQTQQLHLELFKESQRDTKYLVNVAQRLDQNNLPPYHLIRPYIINHWCYDIRNYEVMVYAVDHQRKLAQLITTNIPNAYEQFKSQVEEGRLQTALQTATTIIDKILSDYNNANISAHYIKDNYLESPKEGFGMSSIEAQIPTEKVQVVLENSVREIKSILQNIFINKTDVFYQDVQGSIDNINQKVSNKLSGMENTLMQVMERIVDKVKQDIEDTKLEDVRRIETYLLNKRMAATQYGSMAYTIIGLMVDDLHFRFLNENFKFERIKPYPSYTVRELANRLQYKNPSLLKSPIRKLKNAGMVHITGKSTISLTI